MMSLFYQPKLIILTLFALLYFNTPIQAQVLSPNNIKNIDVRSLSESDLKKIHGEMEKQNLNMAQVEAMAISNGMTPEDFAILKSRLENRATEITESNVDAGTKIAQDPIELNKAGNGPEKKFNKKLFGSEIFSNPNLHFSANNNLATPAGYVMGYGDEMQILIYGLQEYTGSVVVSREGKIRLAGVGELHIGGLTYEAALSLIKRSCAKIYRTVGSGQSQVSVNITKIRTINVTVIGAQRPGNYAISSLATVFNALYEAGGPDENGSYRNIELIRNNKVIKTIDLYKFLVKGDRSSDINLVDNDLIRIPVYNTRVSIEGKVKRAGIFELQPNESFEDLLFYAGGFSESAYKSTIKLIQNTEVELKVSDLNKETYSNYIPKNGDVFKVSEILNRFENRVTVKGAVFRPDIYALSEGKTLRDLILQADGLTEDAYLDIAQLYRLKADFTREVLSLNVERIMANDPAHNLVLRKEDELVISSVFSLKEDYTINISGEVRKPGSYPYMEGIGLFDLIIQSGGFTEAASQHIEISRVIKIDSVVKDFTQQSENITLDLVPDFKDKTQNIKLLPNDRIQVRKMPVYEPLASATISGSINYPGEYAISNKTERVLDIINRAGGIQDDADVEGIRVVRYMDKILTDKVEKIEINVPLDYHFIKRNPNSRKNIYIRPGDQVIIPKKKNSVRVLGAVQLTSEIPFSNGKSARYYINSVGGLNDVANRGKIYVVYTNGIAKATKRFLFITNYPKIKPGCEIIVPVKAENKKEKISTVEIASITGVVGSLAGIAVSLTTLLTK